MYVWREEGNSGGGNFSSKSQDYKSARFCVFQHVWTVVL